MGMHWDAAHEVKERQLVGQQRRSGLLVGEDEIDDHKSWEEAHGSSCLIFRGVSRCL